MAVKAMAQQGQVAGRELPFTSITVFVSILTAVEMGEERKPVAQGQQMVRDSLAY